jgi:hypothetical protein|nr:MAG TPA: tail fiber protein [Caudoviricetes sp.]
MITRKQTVKKYTVTAGVFNYNIPFPIYESGDVLVVWSNNEGFDEHTLILGSDYGVTINSAGDGGTVTLKSDRVPIGAILAVVSNIPETQELSLSHTAEVDTKSTEKELDRQVQMIQQLSDALERCVKVGVTSGLTPDEMLKAIFKAYHDILESLAETGSITGAIPVVSTGTLIPRPLKDRFADVVDVRDFGAKPDFNQNTKTGTDNLKYIQDAIYFCAANNKRLRIAGGKYGCWNSGSKRVLSNAASTFDGQYLGGLDIPSGTVIEWADDSWLVQMQPSYAGAFLSNINRPIWMDDTSSVDWSTDGAILINPRIDGSYMPLFTDLTLSQEMIEPCNDNGIGFAGHKRTVGGSDSDSIFDIAQNIFILGGHIKGYRDINGLGGKGIALERGGNNLRAIGTRIDDCCYATSIIFETTGVKTTNDISFSAIDVRRCGFAAMINGQDALSGGAVADPQQASVHWQGTAWCCGHHPDFSTLKTSHYRRHYKHGVVLLYAATGAYVDIVVNNPAGFPNSTYPCGGTRCPSSYPTFDPNAVIGTDAYYESMMRGAGLSGTIGSLVGGWGNSCVVRGVLNGDCDDLWNVNPGVNYGNINRPTNAHNMSLDLKSNGSVQTIFRNDITAPTLTISTISEDRKTITLTENANLADRDSDLIGEHLQIEGAYYPVIKYVASTRTVTLSSVLASTVVTGNQVYIISSFSASGTNMTGMIKAECRNVTQYLTPFWSASLTQLYADITTLSGENQCRVLSPIPMYANGRLTGSAYGLANGGVSLGNPFCISLDAEKLTSGRTGTLEIAAPTKISGNLIPTTDNAYALGIGQNRWTQVFAASATINTSDEREKQQIADIPDAVFRAWGKVAFRQFLFNDAVEKKGDAARLHIGVIAQQVAEAFASEGLDAMRYGLLCYDEWPEQQEVSHIEQIVVSEGVQDADGNYITPPMYEDKVIVEQEYRPAGGRYGIRYEEALALECAYQRWLGEKMDARLTALELKDGVE